jgi:phytoene dehydrogenase-like protein
LYLRLMDRAALPPSFAERIEKWRCGSGTFRMNVALAELPTSPACRDVISPSITRAGILMAPSLAYMEQAYFDARTHGWSREPIVEMVISSTLDDTLAPPGQACREPVLPARRAGTAEWIMGRPSRSGRRPDDRDGRPPCAELQGSVLGRQIMSPLDLERTFGLVGGDIFHGALDLGQMFSARPMLGHADYRGPLPGLYMCGSGTHPGGGVTGLPGTMRRGNLGFEATQRGPHPGACEASVSKMAVACGSLERVAARGQDEALLVVRRVRPRIGPGFGGWVRPKSGAAESCRSARCRGGSRACG